MIIRFILISIIFLSASIAVPAEEAPAAKNWNSVDGVTPQSSERVDQINTYKKKQRDAEIKELQEGWKQEGVTVQSDERVKHLNTLEKKRREQEVREVKCTMCTMRCQIVSDAGKSACVDGEEASSGPETCKGKADSFLEACLNQCESC